MGIIQDLRDTTRGAGNALNARISTDSRQNITSLDWPGSTPMAQSQASTPQLPPTGIDMPHTDAIHFGGFTLTPERHTLETGGQPVALHARAFSLLVFLAQNRDRVVTREEIIEHVWAGMTVADNNLSVQLSNLRRILRENGGDPQWIVNLPSRGYRFVAPIAQPLAVQRQTPPETTTSPAHLPDARTHSHNRQSIFSISILLSILLTGLLAWALLLHHPHDLTDAELRSSLSIMIAPPKLLTPTLTNISQSYDTVLKTTLGDDPMLGIAQPGTSLQNARYELEISFAQPSPQPDHYEYSAILSDRTTHTIVLSEVEKIRPDSSRAHASRVAVLIRNALEQTLYWRANKELTDQKTPLARLIRAYAAYLDAWQSDGNPALAVTLAHEALLSAPYAEDARLLNVRAIDLFYMTTPGEQYRAEEEKALDLSQSLVGSSEREFGLEAEMNILTHLGMTKEALALGNEWTDKNEDSADLVQALLDARLADGKLEELDYLLNEFDSFYNKTGEATALFYQEGNYPKAYDSLKYFISQKISDSRLKNYLLYTPVVLKKIGYEKEGRIELARLLNTFPLALRHAAALKRTSFHMAPDAWSKFQRDLRSLGMPE